MSTFFTPKNIEPYSTRVGYAIRYLRKRKGLTLDQVAEAIEVNKGSISKIENGKQGYTGEFIEKIARALETTPLEIYEIAERGGIEDGPDVKGTVPIISWVQAGAWNEAIDNLRTGEGERVQTTYRAKPHTYALRVRSDSMEPKFPDGCIIIVEPEEDPLPGKFVVVRQNGNEATFKQLIKDGDTLLLKPLNSRYPIMPLTDDAVFCGVVKRMEMDV